MSGDGDGFVFRAAGEGARDMELRAAEGKSGTRRFAERVLDVRTDERAWRRGAIGEEKVGRTLVKLPSEWAVVHDLTIGSRGANLDHLVIGPPGVFTLNTKNLTGTVTVYDRAILHNGQKTRFLPEARREAECVSEALTRAVGRPVSARPVIVLAGSAELVVKGRTGVPVMHRLALRRWLRKQRPALLDPRLIELLEGAARAETTWRPARPAGAASPPIPVTESAPPTPPSSAAPSAAADLELRPWKRFGHDRLYVNTAQGDTLGYLDRTTGALHVEDQHHRLHVEEALRAAGMLPG